MNEQIKLLAAQASDDGDHIHYYNLAFAEKFAKLIIKECVVMADDFECDVNQRGLVDRMKQHFGVK